MMNHPAPRLPPMSPILLIVPVTSLVWLSRVRELMALESRIMLLAALIPIRWEGMTLLVSSPVPTLSAAVALFVQFPIEFLPVL